MIGLCDMCAFKQSDCKGNKDLEKVHCAYYKKPDVFNAKEAAEKIAELEKVQEHFERETLKLAAENVLLKRTLASVRIMGSETVSCEKCKYFYDFERDSYCEMLRTDGMSNEDFCSLFEQKKTE